MKQTRFTKIAALLLACVLLAGVALSFSVSATTASEITETASIKSVNVEHRDFMHLAFNVETTGEHTGTIGIMVWAADVEDYTTANALYSSYVLKSDGAGTSYYASQSIPAKNIATKYQVAVVEKDGAGNVTIISVPEEHSVEAWAQTKLTQNPSADEANLYNKVIAYGQAAAAVINK